LPRLIILAGIKTLLLPYPVQALVHGWSYLVNWLEGFCTMICDWHCKIKAGSKDACTISAAQLDAEATRATLGVLQNKVRGRKSMGMPGHRRGVLSSITANAEANYVPGKLSANKTLSKRSRLMHCVVAESLVEDLVLAKLTHKLLKDGIKKDMESAGYYTNWVRSVQLLLEPAKHIQGMLQEMASCEDAPQALADLRQLYVFPIDEIFATTK